MKLQDQILKYTKYYEITIASCVVIIVLAFSSYLYLIPNILHAKLIYDQGKLLQNKLSVVRQKDSSLSNFDSTLYKNVLIHLGEILPESRDYVSFFTTFDNLEQRTGVRIAKTDIQLGLLSTQSGRLVKQANSPAYVIPITLEVVGDTQTIPAFFSGLQNLEGRLITINSIQWSSKSNRPDEIHADIGGYAYYYPLPGSLGKVDSPLPKLSKKQEEIITKIQSQHIEVKVDDFTTVKVGVKNLF